MLFKTNLIKIWIQKILLNRIYSSSELDIVEDMLI